ncbi:hypothetical protein C0993_009840, partial [Termitomyces sp. T159_Od127]
GLANWRKVHKGSKKCAENLKRWKATQVIVKSRMKAAQFFAPKAPHVEPTVSAPQPIQSTSLIPSKNQSPPMLSANACPDAMKLLYTFKRKIKALPTTVKVAHANHPLAAFSSDPQGCVEDGEDAWEEWDGPLNTLLQKKEDDLRDLVWIGDNGLIGLHRFLEYLVVHHGVKGALIEGKVMRLMGCIDEQLNFSSAMGVLTEGSNRAPLTGSTTDNHVSQDDLAPHPFSASVLIDVDALPDHPISPNVILTSAPIDVDALPDNLGILTSSSKESEHQMKKICLGIRLDFPPGKSPHSTYSFAIHDMLGDPWDYSVHSGTMTLRA